MLIQIYGGRNTIEVLPTEVLPPRKKYWSQVAQLRIAMRERLQIGEDTCLLLFVGTYDYAPNREAIKFLADKVLPDLEELDVSCLVAGRGTEALQARGVRALGYLENLEEVYAASDLVLIPLLSGGGVKVKTLQALAYGKKVIATSEGISGIARE